MGNMQILKSIMIMLNEWINRRVKAKNSYNIIPIIR
jgi:hypothetical protein